MALSELVLTGNRLTTVPEQTSCLPSLQKLDVADNAIRRVPRSVLKAWGELSKLVSLDLHHNSLTSLPDEIGQLRGMKCLFLHDNALSSLPATIASLTQLEDLTLTGNRLGNEFTEFPVAEAQKRIVLDRNFIRELPHLKLVNQTTQSNVVRVSATNNQLRRLPTTTTPALAMCKELHLEHNAIRELPDAFFESLPLLEEIVLHHNRLLRVPASIAKCKCLRVVDMHANRISEVPSELVDLSQLEVLDLMDNALQAIPVRWHAFRKHSRGSSPDRRVLQTLVLRRNPIRNNVLKAIVDGAGHDGVSEVAAALTNSSDRVCENVLRKLIASLRDAATTNAAFDRVSSDSEEEDEDEREQMHRSATVTNGRRKWRGVTRDVNRYLSQRLRAMKRQKSEGSMKRSLRVEVKSFERMIKSLPFACSKLELATLIKRLTINDMEGKQWVDGNKFLAEIDSLGQSGSLGTAFSASPRRTGASQITDAVAQILHYLSIMHRQQQKSRNGDNQGQLQAKPSVDRPLEYTEATPTQPKATVKTAKVATRVPKPRVTSSPAKRTSEARSKAAANAFVARVSAPSRGGELARQRQRVEVLQQQLMDHKLQLLHRSRQPSASPIAPAAMGDVSSSEPSESESDCDPDDGSDIICVRVSLPTSGPTVDAPATVGAHHLDVRIGVRQTVLDLKQRIEVRTSLPVGDQILIAKDRGEPVGIRLCNDSTIQQSVRSDHRITEKTPWRLLLLLRHGV